MLKLLTLFLWCYGALALPTVLQSRPLVQNAEQPVVTLLPGVENLDEKSLPETRIYTYVSGSLPGTRNHAEKIQIESSNTLPGTHNLAEKSIPEAVIFKLAQEYPKSEYESF